MIHSAYRQRAAKNLRYWATHQTVADTAQRFASGQGLVAEADGRLLGTLTVRPPQPEAEVALFRDPATWTLCQFAVLPEHQETGIGRQSHGAALAHAGARGGHTMALDTAAPATDLIAMYGRWGYRIVGEYDWRTHTNYPSVVMSRPIKT